MGEKTEKQLLKGEADYLFEASWEVCNKVGGIYTVIASKAALMKEKYPCYTAVGPYFEKQAETDFEEAEPPQEFRKAFSELEKQGLKCRYGAWQVKGEPKTILLEFKALENIKNDLKKLYWEKHGVDSLNSGFDFDEPLMFSTAAGLLVEQISLENKDKQIVMHCHEWLAGFAVLHLKQAGSSVKTVFTTHATMLGRSMAGNGENLYEMLDSMNPEEEARKYKVQDKFTAERAMARAADVFTTVSEITGLEAEKILGRKPDVLLLNGLDLTKFPTMEEASIKHVTSRDIIRDFLTYYFFPHYHFDLRHNLMLYISGRYEFSNKGFDVFIKALGKLNRQLQKEKYNRTITAFFWVPMGNKGINPQVMENKEYYSHIKNYIDVNSKDILKRITYDFITSKDPRKHSIFTKKFLKEMKKEVLHFKRKGNPLLSTHLIDDYDKDPIIQTLLKEGLNNQEGDPVKVVVYPAYLNGSDSLINLPIYEAMAGCHLGVFPSYYEPWGYTPLESAALGVPAVTTDLAGFGQFIEPKLPKENRGLFVLKRFKKTPEEIVEGLYRILYNFALLDHAERVQRKLNAKTLSNLADWDHLVKNYVKAHNEALK